MYSAWCLNVTIDTRKNRKFKANLVVFLAVNFRKFLTTTFVKNRVKLEVNIRTYPKRNSTRRDTRDYASMGETVVH